MPVDALVTVAAIVVLAASFWLGSRWARRDQAVVQRVDEELAPVSVALEAVVARAEEVRAQGAPDREVASRLERLLDEIAAEGTASQAFRRAADELVPALAGTPRLPAAKQPASRDELTGVRDRSGYEAELQREIARAQRTERPLALVLVDLGDLRAARARTGHAEVDRLLQEFAALLVGTTRATDAVCRRRADGFGIVLPETSATAARFVRGRIREQAARAAMGRLGPVTFSTGIVEWRPGETVEAFDARAVAAVEPQSERPLARPG